MKSAPTVHASAGTGQVGVCRCVFLRDSLREGGIAMTTIPKRDPSAVYARKAIAGRKKGVGSRCGCGEVRPEALIREKNRVICHECKRRQKGMKIKDDHHFAAHANSDITLPIPVNDH